MPTVTVSVPTQIKQQMDTLTEVNWSEVARKAFVKRIQDQKLFEKLVEHSTMTQEDSIKLGRDLKRDIAKHYK
jgi:Arc/MetJ-type ribon-helix-helix transcriptional regulator